MFIPISSVSPQFGVVPWPVFLTLFSSFSFSLFVSLLTFLLVDSLARFYSVIGSFCRYSEWTLARSNVFDISTLFQDAGNSMPIGAKDELRGDKKKVGNENSGVASV